MSDVMGIMNDIYKAYKQFESDKSVLNYNYNIGVLTNKYKGDEFFTDIYLAFAKIVNIEKAIDLLKEKLKERHKFIEEENDSLDYDIIEYTETNVYLAVEANLGNKVNDELLKILNSEYSKYQSIGGTRSLNSFYDTYQEYKERERQKVKSKMENMRNSEEG